MTAPPRSLSLVALVLAIAVVAVLARVALGGHTWADVRYHAEIAPPRLAAAESVAAHALPAWWDGSGFGVPLAAEPTHGALYPLTWLATSVRALDVIAVLHLAWLALGVAIWARRRARRVGAPGASEEAALVAGLLAATTGLALSTALRGSLPALAHLPWIGAAATAIVDAVTRRDRVRAVASLAALLGLVGLTGSAAGLIDAVVLGVALAGRRRTLGALAVALGAGLAIAAVQWLPTALHLLAGDRAGATVAALPLARLVELVVPGSFGSSDPGRSLRALAGAVPWAPSLYAGVPLLALAAVRTPPRRVLAVYAVLVALALGAGRPGPWPAWLGAPEHHLAALVTLLAVNAAAGIDALLVSHPRAVRSLVAGAVCGAIALGALAVLRTRTPSATVTIDRALFDGALGLVGVIAALVLVGRGRGTPGRAPFVLALLVVPGVSAGGSLAPLVDRAVVTEAPAWAIAATTRAAPQGAPARVYRPAYFYSRGVVPIAAAERDARSGIAEAMATLAGNTGWRFGVALARSDDPARAAAHDATWLAAAREGGVLLDRYGVELAILPASLVVPRKLTALGTRGEWTLSALPVAPPAAVLRGVLWAVAPEDALALLFPAGGNMGVLRGSVVLRGAGESHPDRGPPLGCGVAHWRAGDIVLACATPTPGMAVVSSAAAAGWHVSVDAREVPWFTADVIRRAVAVNAGYHRVAWSYHTPGQTAGLWCALAGLALLAGYAVRRKALD